MRCPSVEIRNVVEAALIDLPGGLKAEKPAEIELVGNTSSEEISIFVDGRRRVRARSPNAALASLLTVITRLALDAEADRLHLHCAAVAMGEPRRAHICKVWHGQIDSCSYARAPRLELCQR